MQESFGDELNCNVESVLGQRLKMRFIDEDSSLKWYNGRIISFDPNQINMVYIFHQMVRQS